MSKPKIHPRMKDHFRCFSRNGQWGTCVDCPRTSEDHVVPEACINFTRGDHRLDVDSLARQHVIWLRDLSEMEV